MAFCRSLKVQVQFKLAARSMLHGSACASMRVALPCRPVAVCRKGLLGDEQAAHFPLENGVFGVENGSERRLRRGRSRPRGLMVTVSGDGLFFDAG